MKAWLLSLACGLAACGGPSLRGAIAVEEGAEPRAEDARQPLIPTACHDRAGRPARVASEFWLVAAGTREVLVETRRGYASIVVTNRIDSTHGRMSSGHDPQTVFQFVSDDGDGPALLHDVRFARNAPTRATLTVTDSFDEQSLGGGMMAATGPVLVRCRLDTRQSLE